MGDLQAIGILALLLLGNAFFVAAEFAMVTARRDQLEPRAAQGSTAAKWALRGIEDVSTSLAATQLGITACSLVIGSVGEPAIAHLLEPAFAFLHVPGSLVHPVALVVALLIVTFLHMVIGEMVPKNMAIARPAASALLLGPVLRVFAVILRPLIALMNGVANGVVKHVFRAQPRDEVASAFTSDEVLGFLAESGREGLLDDDEIRLLTGALQFERLTARDVAIPFTDLVTVPGTATVDEVERLAVETGFSRFPVLTAGEPTGYVHVKDVLGLPGDAGLPPAAIHPFGQVAAGSALQAVVRTMQRTNAHFALVGADTTGRSVVTLEDVLEELVGEVRDATSPVT